ncbi:MAG: hypothetical protein ABSA11_09120 [Candidatus Bathyarchaeia archaeon]
MARRIDAYVSVGLGFVGFGAPLAAYCYWIVHIVPLTALGLALVVLGVSVVLIPQNPVPTSVVRGMVEDACANVEAELEQFDAREKAWYLPPRDGCVLCFVPLVADVKPAVVQAASRAPVKMLTESMGVPGLMVFPPGSKILRSSQLDGDAGLEDAMINVLVDYLEGAESVKVIKEGSRVNVFIKKTRLQTDFSRFNYVLGSITVSVLGCVAAQVLNVPVRVLDERTEGRNLSAIFEVLGVG